MDVVGIEVVVEGGGATEQTSSRRTDPVIDPHVVAQNDRGAVATGTSPGDPIFVTTVQGAFRYEVTRVFVVKPEQVDVQPSAGDQLTLTTCHPRFTAAHRLVVTADLKGPAAAPGPPAPNVNPNPAFAASEAAPADQEVVGASGDPSERVPTALWGTVRLGPRHRQLGARAALAGQARPGRAAPGSVWTFYTHLGRPSPLIAAASQAPPRRSGASSSKTLAPSGSRTRKPRATPQDQPRTGLGPWACTA